MARKKGTRHESPGPALARHSAPAPATRSLRRAPLLLAVLALTLALPLVLRMRSSQAAPPVPDPVTAEMLPPVRRALEQARAGVLGAPASAAAWGEFAELCDAHHLYAEAELAYRQARTLDPLEFRWTYGLALVRDFMGAGAEELTGLFAAAIRLQPRYPPARLRSGDALVRQGRLAEARSAFEAAIELDPAFAMAHRNLGQTLLALEDVAGALAHLERAAELDPADGVVASSLAQAYWLAGDEARAARAAEEGRRKAPVYGVPDPVRFAVDSRNVAPLACERRASEGEQRADWRAALPDLERLADSSPTEAGVHWRLGRCLRALGERERATQELERALALAPEHLGATLELGALSEERDFARAAELYARATRSAPASGAAWKRLGACLGPLGDLPGALAAFERAAAAGEQDAELFHNWGTALGRAGRDEEACQRLRAALALEPDNAATHFSLGASLAALGKRAEALTHFERAQVLDPSLPTAEALAALRGGR